MAERPIEKSQEPIRASSPPSLDPEQPLLQETPMTHPAGLMAAPLDGTLLPVVSPTSQRNFQTEPWVPGLSLQAFAVITLAMLTFSLSCSIALVTGSADLSQNVLYSRFPHGGPSVRLVGEVYHFDWSKPEKVSVRWHLSGDRNHTVDIYFNNLLNPVFSWQFYGPSSFELEYEVDIVRPGYYSPSDSYTFSSLCLAFDKITNKTMPIVHPRIRGLGPGDFSMESTDNPPDTPLEGGPVAGTTNYLKWETTIKRPANGRVLTYFMFVINWILTLCSIITTLVVSKREYKVPDGISIFPVTAILTISAVRNLYVGSPPFGIFLDNVGFFPQMLIVMECTVIVLANLVLRTARGKSVVNEGEV